jgi:hypothetical protein
MFCVPVYDSRWPTSRQMQAAVEHIRSDEYKTRRAVRVLKKTTSNLKSRHYFEILILQSMKMLVFKQIGLETK